MSKDYSKISEKWKPANRNLGIFILYSRDVSLQPPFAEVLSGLLLAAYWPLVFLFSSFSGLFWPGSFFPSFRIWIPKRCKGELSLSRVFFGQMSLSQGSAKFRFLFLALIFVRFFCRRLFAKFFDLRSWLSVSLPLRSVGTPSPPPRESCFFKPRNNLEPCTDSLELCRRVWHRRKSEQRTFG